MRRGRRNVFPMKVPTDKLQILIKNDPLIVAHETSVASVPMSDEPITTDHQPKGVLPCATWSNASAHTARVASSLPRLPLPFPTRLPAPSAVPSRLPSGRKSSFAPHHHPISRSSTEPLRCSYRVIYCMAATSDADSEAGRRGAGQLVHEKSRICFTPDPSTKAPTASRAL